MAADLAILGVSIDARGAEDGALKAEAAITRVQTASRRLNASMQEQATVARQVSAQAKIDADIQKQVADAIARRREASQRAAQEEIAAQGGVVRVIKTVAEARAEGRASLERMTEAERRATLQELEMARATRATAEAMTGQQARVLALAAAREAAWAKGGALARAESAAYDENAKRLAAANAVKRQATTQTNILNRSLTTLSLSAAGIPGPVGRAVSSLSALAAGGATTLAIVGGIGLVSLAFEKLGGEARRAKKETDDLIASLIAQQEEESGVAAARNLAKVKAEAELERGRLGSVGTLFSEIAGRRGDLSAAASAQTFLEARQEADEKRKREERERIEEAARIRAERAATEARDNARALRDLSLDAASAIAKAHGNAARVIQLEYEQTINALRESFGRLGAAVPPELLKILDVQRRADLIGAGLTPRVVGSGTAFGGLQLRGIDAPVTPADEARRIKAEQDQILADAKSRYEAALRTMNDTLQRGFDGLFRDGLTGFAGFFDAIGNLARQMAASVAASMTIKALGIDKMLDDISKGNLKFGGIGTGFTGPGAGRANAAAGFGAGIFGGQLGAQSGGAFSGAALGGLSGAGLGFATGGPIGGIVGGVTGLVSGLLGGAEKAREAARRMKEAQEDFQRSLDAYVEAAGGGSTNLSVALRENEARAEQLRREARELLKPTFGELRRGDVSGLDRVADTIREIDEAAKKYEAQLRAEAEARAQNLREDLSVRALRAQGRDEEAEAMALQLAQAREWAAFQKDLGDAFDVAFQAQLAFVQGLERQAIATAAATRAAEEEAARRQRQQSVIDDIAVRQLVVDGREDEAEALRLQIAHQREYEEAVRGGIEAVTLSTLAEIQRQEQLALAANQATREMEKLARAIEAEARATEDLTVRHLRATGAVYAADEAQQFFAQQLERRRAIEESRSAEFLAYLDEVQEAERAFSDSARRTAQQEAFQRALGTGVESAFAPNSRTSVNLAVGISESTGGRIAGTLTSGLAYWASLPRIEDILRESLAVQRRLADGGLLSMVDAGLATLSAGADAAAGLPPGNR